MTDVVFITRKSKPSFIIFMFIKIKHSDYKICLLKYLVQIIQGVKRNENHYSYFHFFFDQKPHPQTQTLLIENIYMCVCVCRHASKST